AHWRTNTNPTIVHTYYDDWYLTGMSVREDLGMNVGVMFEDPSFARARSGFSANTYFEANLWRMARLLDLSFISGRANTAGQRDVTVNELKNRFDKDTNGGIPSTDARLWGFEPAAFRVKTFSFSNANLSAAMAMTNTKQILNDYFLANTDVITAPTLLFVSESSFRSVSLGTTGAQNTSTQSLSLASATAPTQTIATMNWTPFQYKGASLWQGYTTEQYMPRLAARLQPVMQADPNLSISGAVLNGSVTEAQSFYMALLTGVTNIVAINDLPLTLRAAQSDTNLAAKIKANGVTAAAVANVAVTLVMEIAAHYSTEYQTYLQFIGAKQGGIIGKVTRAINGSGFGGERAFGDVGAVVVLTGGVVVALGMAGVIPDADKWAFYLQSGLIAAVQADAIMSGVKQISLLGTRAGDATTAIKNLSQNTTRAAKVAGVVAVVVDIGLNVGLFTAQMVADHIAFGSLEFNQAFAQLVATIIVSVLMFVIAAIPVIGPLIVAVIGLIDAIVGIVCKAVGVPPGSDVKKWVCGGISGLLTQIIAHVIYSNQPLVDLGHDNRLVIGDFTPSLVYPERGFQSGNSLASSLVVTSTLFRNGCNGWMSCLYAWQFSNSAVRESDFEYELQQTKRDLHGSLSASSVNSDWGAGQYGGSYSKRVVVGSITPNTLGAGINSKIDLYLAEGYAINAQECILIWTPFTGPIPICYLRDKKDTLFQNIGAGMRFDVFPATLDEFYAPVFRGNDSYSLQWDARFPTQCDFDGDGLRSKACGGNDPNDANADSDGDGLSDYDEALLGTNPLDPDTDHDGLSDYQEVFYGTNPRQADSDGDGLLDCEEVFHQVKVLDPFGKCGTAVGQWKGGWTYVYDFDSSNNPLRTLVTSDPTVGDTDGDGVFDNLEKIYGFHPRVLSVANVLNLVTATYGDAARTAPLYGFVAPGQTIYYNAQIENYLRDRYALGLLEVDYPAAVQSANLLPQPYELYPRQAVTLTGSVLVRSDIAQTQQLTLTNRAGAEIADLGSIADERSAWLHFNENAGATLFGDTSLNGNVGT
ncbi:MAG: hypothetical protein ABI874_07395, partial [Chloroflexota bacterium]